MADDANPRAIIGANNPPEPTPFEGFKVHLDDLRIEAGNWLDGSPIETQAQADEVSRLMDEYRRAGRDADAARKVEKEPHLKAAQAVDALWKPLIDGAALCVDTCKKVLAPWLIKLEAEQRAAAELARKEADDKARIAAEAARTAALSDIAAREEAEGLISDAEAAARAAKQAEKARPQSHGGDRATTLRTYYTPVLVDGQEALRHYWLTNRPALEAFALSLAEKDVQSGKRQIPGFTVKEERRVV